MCNFKNTFNVLRFLASGRSQYQSVAFRSCRQLLALDPTKLFDGLARQNDNKLVVRVSFSSKCDLLLKPQLGLLGVGTKPYIVCVGT